MAGRGVFDASHEAGVLDRGVLITSLALKNHRCQKKRGGEKLAMKTWGGTM